MAYTVGLIHATLNSVKPINDAFYQYAPDITVLNFLDDGLDYAVSLDGEITPKTLRRFIDILDKAEESNVDGILLCCSIFSPHVSDVASLFTVPVVGVDLSMMTEAVQTGEKVGLIATNQAAGPISTKLLRDTAEELGKPIKVQTAYIPEAFAALKRGDTELHNQLIIEKINDLSNSCDVIVLAQLSMTRVMKHLEDVKVPVLTSPEVSIKSIIERIKQSKSSK